MKLTTCIKKYSNSRKKSTLRKVWCSWRPHNFNLQCYYTVFKNLRHSFLYCPMPMSRNPSSTTIDVKNYHFQIGCWRNLAIVVNQNCLIREDSYRCFYYYQKYRWNWMPLPHISLQIVVFWRKFLLEKVKSTTLPMSAYIQTLGVY